MSDDISLFHPRMKKPAVIAVVGGFGLGFLAVGAQRIQGGGTPLWIGALMGILAAGFLYGIMYRNLKHRLQYERSELGDENGE
jgi:high-affinity Fe2+/Pb2+ permease